MLIFRNEAKKADVLALVFQDDVADADALDAILAQHNAASIWIADPEARWFHTGLNGEGGIVDLAQALADLTRDYPRTICIGAGRGAYAALLYGRLLGADAILAIAPRTTLTPQGLDSLEDQRDRDSLARVADETAYPQGLDVAPLYADPMLETPDQRITLVIGSAEHRLDLAHAARLPRARTVVLSAQPMSPAALGTVLEDSGVLALLTAEALTGVWGAEPVAQYAAWRQRFDYAVDVDESQAKLTDIGDLHLVGTLHNPGVGSLNLRPFFEVSGVGAETQLLIGARLRRAGVDGPWLAEYRCAVERPTLRPGETCPFDLAVPLSTLPPGRYQLRLDLVNEGRFWVEEIGGDVVVLELDA